MHRVTRVDRCARGEGTHAHGVHRGVAGDDFDVVEIHTELIRGDLRQRGFVRLALRRGASVEGDFSRGGHTHRGAFIGAEASGLHCVGDADAQITPLRARCCLALRKAVIVCGLKRSGKARREVAAVVGHRTAIAENNPHLVRHLRRLDEIASPHFGAIEV